MSSLCKVKYNKESVIGTFFSRGGDTAFILGPHRPTLRPACHCKYCT